MIETDYLEESERLIEDLRNIPTLKPFDEDSLNKLLRMSKIKKYNPNELIFKEGFFDNWIYFLVNGKVKIMKNGKKLSVLKKRGDVFGEMGVIDGSPKSASVYAINSTVCLATDSSHIEKLSGNDRIAFGYILYRVFTEILAARLRVTNDELIKAKSKTIFKFFKKKRKVTEKK